MFGAVLQVVDSFLLNYNVGDALVAGVVLGVVPILPQRSLKLLGLHTITFGLLFLLLPASMFQPATGSVLGSAIQYKFVGLGLLVVAPVLYTVGRD
jgi:uncharacterized membrane protein YvlD (DUF360 family)